MVAGDEVLLEARIQSPVTLRPKLAVARQRLGDERRAIQAVGQRLVDALGRQRIENGGGVADREPACAPCPIQPKPGRDPRGGRKVRVQESY